ncbi:MAG: hypothetical protein OH316_00220 [Candidatus Parvarchaeota archaeon]|nr:hypothetical protein [Candidatus Parvarchaeota archaeon]
MKIKNVVSRKILNSNTNYTIEVKLVTENGLFRGSSPAGESTSEYEVKQFKEDIDQIVSKFNTFLKGFSGRSISSLDEIFDIEKNIPEEFIGGASLSLSYALISGLAASKGLEPFQLFSSKQRSKVLPICKMIGGGMHASRADMSIQEILAVTISDSVQESIDSTIKVYNEVKRLLSDKTISFIGGVDPEGGLISGLDDYESLSVVSKAVNKIMKETGEDIRLGIDAAASTFFKDERYTYKKPIYGKLVLSKEEQIDLMVKLAEEFNLYYIEDPVDENFQEGYKEVMRKTKALVVGDDLTATKTERLEKAKGDINATLIKPNQVGLMGEVVRYSALSDKYKLTKVLSHRSEETNSSMISDLAVGLGAKYIKVGINRGERIEKLNRLSEITG